MGFQGCVGGFVVSVFFLFWGGGCVVLDFAEMLGFQRPVCGAYGTRTLLYNQVAASEVEFGGKNKRCI